MSLYSDDPEFKKAFDSYAKEIFKLITKRFEDYLAPLISEWITKELKKMGYSKEK